MNISTNNMTTLSEHQQQQQHSEAMSETSLMDSNLDHVQLIADIGYMVSLLTLAFALLILTCIKRLRCPKNNLHLQLFISFMIRCGCHWIKRLFVHGTWIPYGLDLDVSCALVSTCSRCK